MNKQFDEELQNYLPNATVHDSVGHESCYSSKQLYNKVVKHLDKKKWDAIILNKKYHKTCVKKRAYVPFNAYLTLSKDDRWKKKRKARILYLSSCCFRRKHRRYVAPFQYYLLAVLLTLLFVVIVHFISKSKKLRRLARKIKY